MFPSFLYLFLIAMDMEGYLLLNIEGLEKGTTLDYQIYKTASRSI